MTGIRRVLPHAEGPDSHSYAQVPKLRVLIFVTNFGQMGGASVYKVLLEEVQVVLDVGQEVLVALGARRDGAHGFAQAKLHIRIRCLCLGALHSAHSARWHGMGGILTASAGFPQSVRVPSPVHHQLNALASWQDPSTTRQHCARPFSGYLTDLVLALQQSRHERCSAMTKALKAFLWMPSGHNQQRHIKTDLVNEQECGDAAIDQVSEPLGLVGRSVPRTSYPCNSDATSIPCFASVDTLTALVASLVQT